MKLNLKIWIYSLSRLIKTNYLLIIFFLLVNLVDYNAQKNDFKIYRWEEIQNADPDTIYGISFSKEKRTELPDSIIKFRNLKYVNISKNKFSSLPFFLDSLKNLEIFVASKNEFKNFPPVILELKNLKQLIINRNDIEIIPTTIDLCINLEKIDLGDNAIATFPETFFTLENLKIVDLTGIRFGPKYQNYIKNRRKDIRWILDPPCDCVE